VRKSLAKPDQLMRWWLTLTLTANASFSAPFLIDGISYVKVLIALILISCLVPIILIRLTASFSPRTKLVIFLIFVSMNVYLMYLYLNSYRSVFGAPGRHNGLLTVIACFYFFVIGMYVRKFWSIWDVYKTISIVSVSTSFCILVVRNLNIGSNSIFASNDFTSRNFADNSNLIAPLICVGILSSIVSFRKTRKYLFLVSLIPLAIVAIQLSVVQVYLNLTISLLILGISTSKRKIKASWIPVTIFGGYLIGLFLAFQGLFDRDSSTKERTDILREAGNLWNEFTLFPSNIDGVSDYNQNFVSFYGTEFLDDFHNVFLQTSFSFGLIIGFLFLFLAVTPYFAKFQTHKEKLEFLSVYTSLLVSLLIGISSPNYIYIFFLLLGYSSLGVSKSSQIVATKQSNNNGTALGLAILLTLIPAYIQLEDLKTRIKISDRASKIKASNGFTEQNFNALVRDLREIDDAGYRNRMALNFYSIGECKYGDLVYEMMIMTNSSEARLRGLRTVSNNCSQNNE
jgi:hypothetical protein